jgi:signal peptidase I
MSPKNRGEGTAASEDHQKRRDKAAEIANTFEWLITAFILAFVFRAFVMEAFRIPTGSMADTLKGAHFRLNCLRCGYKYDYGFEPLRYGLEEDTIPPGSVRLLDATCCPSCGSYLPARAVVTPVANGDRILVLKCIYQFFEPKRWDVIVFKNPTNPSENYIKRLIGLPNEQVEIIDGDVYINGKISRKPSKVQDEVWMPVYDNDYQPVAVPIRTSRDDVWQQPFNNDTDSEWILEDTNDPTVFRLDSPPGRINWLIYKASPGNDFRATYAYDSVVDYADQPDCSDLMVRFYMRYGAAEGRVGIALSKYQTVYRAWVDLTGEMLITKVSQGEETILTRKVTEPPVVGKSSLVKFANFDHQLIFQFGREKLTYDLGRSLEDVGPREADTEPVKIFGAGKLRLSHIAVFRDIHYTEPPRNDGTPCLAAENHAFKLDPDEFFVLGDNSPRSADGRLWDRPDKASRTFALPRQGIVPRDYLVGKALFVYWPSGFEFPWPKSVKAFLATRSQYNRLAAVIYWIASLRWIPNVGEMRLIYGGTNENEKSYIAKGKLYQEQDAKRAANDTARDNRL